MQNLYNYTQYFRAGQVDANAITNLQNRFADFDKFYKENLPINQLGYLTWAYKDTSCYDPAYNNIIKIYAEYLHVKVIYRDQLDETEQPTEGYYFVGDEQRICILKHIWDHTYNLIQGYKEFEGFNKKGYTKTIARNKTNELVSNIIEIVKKFLVIDLSYEFYIEKYVQRNFKLDYKKYQTDSPEYYHAISKEYHHKRVLL